jgi:hypothetical protein
MNHMKNKLIFICLLLCSNAFSLGEQSLIENALETYKKAFEAMEKYHDLMSVHIYTTYGYNEKTTHYNYWFSSELAKQSWLDYKNASATLEQQLFIRDFGEGFLIGFIIGSGNRFIGNETFDKKTLIATALSIIAAIIYHNHKYDKVGYYDLALARYDNFFTKTKTFAGICCGLIAGFASYTGGDYMITRLKDLCHSYKTK